MFMSLTELRQLMESGQFHHATFRNRGTIWEGLWIYRKYDGLRGFEPAGAFLKDNPDSESAYEMTRSTGISVGAYGQG